MIAGRANVTAVAAKRLKTRAHLGGDLRRCAIRENRPLINAANQRDATAKHALHRRAVVGPDVAADAGRAERFTGVAAVGRDVIENRHHAAAGVIHDRQPDLVQRRNHSPVVRHAELVEHRRADHRRTGRAAAVFDQVKLCARQLAMNKRDLPPRHLFEEMMHHRRVIQRPEDGCLRAGQFTKLLPNARLRAHLDKPAHDPVVTGPVVLGAQHVPVQAHPRPVSQEEFHVAR